MAATTAAAEDDGVWEAVLESLQSLSLSSKQEMLVVKATGAPAPADWSVGPHAALVGLTPVSSDSPVAGGTTADVLRSRSNSLPRGSPVAVASSHCHVTAPSSASSTLQHLWDPLVDSEVAQNHRSNRRSSSVVDSPPLQAPLGSVSPMTHPYAPGFDNQYRHLCQLILRFLPQIQSSFPLVRWITPQYDDSTKEWIVSILYNRQQEQERKQDLAASSSAGSNLQQPTPISFQGHRLKLFLCDGSVGKLVEEKLSDEDVALVQTSWRSIASGETNTYKSYRRMMKLLHRVKSQTSSASTSDGKEEDLEIKHMTRDQSPERFTVRRFFYTMFYTRFFEIMPNVRWSFNTSLHQHGRTLFKSLESFVCLLTLRSTSQALSEAMRLFTTAHDLGRTVSAAHFAAFGAALEHTLECSLGDQKTQTVMHAWKRFVQMLSSMLVAASGAVDVTNPQAYEVPTSLKSMQGRLHQRRASAPSLLREFSATSTLPRSRSPSSLLRGFRRQSDYSPDSSARSRRRARSRSPSSSKRPVLHSLCDEDSLTPEELEEVEEDED